MDDFKKEYPDMLEEQKAPVEPVMEMPTRIEYEQDHLLRKLEEMEEEETGDQIAEKAFARLTYREPEEKDDVESVVSTYTNTDNRPAVISVSTAVKRTARATSQPEAVSSEQPPASKPVSTALPIPADETKEEKKARKAAIKTAKKEKRVQKKELKESFKSEKAKQVQQTSGTYDTPQGYSVVKIN
jgi:protein LTV1